MLLFELTESTKFWVSQTKGKGGTAVLSIVLSLMSLRPARSFRREPMSLIYVNTAFHISSTASVSQPRLSTLSDPVLSVFTGVSVAFAIPLRNVTLRVVAEGSGAEASWRRSNSI